MNPSIGHIVIFINYQPTWPPLVTIFILDRTNVLFTSTCHMWYNVIVPYIPLDFNLYPTYLIGAKRLDTLIFRNYTNYVTGYVHSILEQHVIPSVQIPHIGNQFIIVVQLVISKNKSLSENVKTSFKRVSKVCPNKDKWVKQVSKKSLKCAQKKRWPKKLQRNPSLCPN